MYRQIRTETWTDPKIKALKPDEKLLFLYLITNPHAHVSGIYYIPFVIIEHETGLSQKALGRGIDTLSKGYLIGIDRASEVVFVRNMLRYQGHGEKILASAAQQLATLHNSPIIKDFLEEYKDLQIPYRYPIEGVSKTPSPVPDPDPVPDPVPDPEEPQFKKMDSADTEVDRWARYFTANIITLKEKFASNRVDWDKSIETWLGWIGEHWKDTRTRKDPLNTVMRWIRMKEFYVREKPGRGNGKPASRPWDGGCDDIGLTPEECAALDAQEAAR